MALIICEEFSAGVRPAEEGGIAFQLAEHDLPLLAGNPIVLAFGPQSAEQLYDALAECLGKTKHIEVVGPDQMPKGDPNAGQ